MFEAGLVGAGVITFFVYLPQLKFWRALGRACLTGLLFGSFVASFFFLMSFTTIAFDKPVTYECDISYYDFDPYEGCCYIIASNQEDGHIFSLQMQVSKCEVYTIELGQSPKATLCGEENVNFLDMCYGVKRYGSIHKVILYLPKDAISQRVTIGNSTIDPDNIAPVPS